jgi:hypothetical protein
MLGRSDKSNEAHLKARKVTLKISIGAIIVIILTSIASIVSAAFDIYQSKSNHALKVWLTEIAPNIFICIDCILLFVALVWIYHSLKHDKQVMGNEKWMGMHTFLLLINLGT